MDLDDRRVPNMLRHEAERQSNPKRDLAKAHHDSSPIRASCKMQRNESAVRSVYGHRVSEGVGRRVRRAAACSLGKPRPKGVVSRNRCLSAPTAPHLSKARASPVIACERSEHAFTGDARAKRRCLPTPERQPIKKPRSDRSPRPRGGGFISAPDGTLWR